MNRTDEPIDLDTLGAFVATQLDGTTPMTSRLAARERLIHAAEGPDDRGWPWLRATAALAVLAAAVIVSWWVWPPPTAPPLAPQLAVVDGSEWMQAPVGGTAALPVGPGAVLALHDGARGRVSMADDARVAVVLEAGRLQAAVDPQAQRRVTIEAGPYRVVVVGTVFRVDWDPVRGAFAVEVTRGKVEVGAPSSSAPIAVDAGRRLVASSDGAVTLAAIETAAHPVARAPDPEVAEPSARFKPSARFEPPRDKPRPRAEPKAPVAPSWQALAHDGKYAEALAAVDAAGFDDALASLPVAALEQLGDAARLASRAAKADAVYLAVRKRFGGSAAAARAAFHLGRQATTPKDAIRWLRTSLDEAPQGTFAKLARGRLISALTDAGDRAAAREAARIYVDSYPDGPHAKIAWALLESP